MKETVIYTPSSFLENVCETFAELKALRRPELRLSLNGWVMFGNPVKNCFSNDCRLKDSYVGNEDEEKKGLNSA